jgi:Legionella pneumophila major outer membrane protein precursor
MKKVLLSVLALGGVIAANPAFSAQNDDVLARIKALERENAAIRKENAALRENKALTHQNTALKSKSGPSSVVATSDPAHRRDPFGAYAADLPVAYKAPVRTEAGQLRLWAEGGAIWSGGDPIYSFFDRTALNGGIATQASVPGSFALTPKLGWEAATGFDYRLAASPWHVSGQFRYGEARQSASAAFSDSVIVPDVPPFTVNSSDSPRADHKEIHWLADMALGRDIIGDGPYAMQFKFGVRTAELRGVTTASNPRSVVIPGSGVFFSDVENVLQESKFLGAGPRLGIDGSAPIGMGWTFDYLGDVAALFGTQRFQRTRSFDNVILLNNPMSEPSIIDATQKFGTVFNSDIQLGVSYWMSQNMKISASYRLDAYFKVLSTLDAKNDPTRLQSIDRYIHGPRLAVTAQF